MKGTILRRAESNHLKCNSPRPRIPLPQQVNAMPTSGNNVTQIVVGNGRRPFIPAAGLSQPVFLLLCKYTDHWECEVVPDIMVL